MSKTPAISVVIPAYNHERYVGAAVDSVLGQSWRDLELIVIDDGSTDNTADVVRQRRDERLTYLHQENRDAFNTINRGLRLARGRSIAILNSDDIYALNRLERLLEVQEATGAACLFTDVIPIDAEGRELPDPDFGWNVWHRKNRDFFHASGDLYTGFLKGNFMVTTSNLFLTREAVQQVGEMCSLRYLHDYDYIFRVQLAFPGKVYYLEEKLLCYRIHGGNTLSEAAILGRQQDQQVIRRYLLAAMPEELRGRVAAGADRLVELEQELQQVRAELAGAVQPGLRQAAGIFRQALGRTLRRRLRRREN